MTTGLKPSWKNLKTGVNYNDPVEEVVGQFLDWRLEPNSFGDNQIIFRLSGCQILASDQPFPYADWEMVVKFSESENSGWGHFGKSAADALGVDIELLDIDLLKGRWTHILRTEKDYGEDKNKPEVAPGVPARIVGKVYNIVKFINAGEKVTSIAPPKNVAVAATVQAATPATTPVVMAEAQVAAVPIATTPVAPEVAPVIQPPLAP